MKVDTKSFAYGLMQSILHFGSVIGCVLSSVFMNRFSRKFSIIYTGIIAGIGCILSIIMNYYLFLLARFISGIAVGLYSVLVPVYSKIYVFFINFLFK